MLISRDLDRDSLEGLRGMAVYGQDIPHTSPVVIPYPVKLERFKPVFDTRMVTAAFHHAFVDDLTNRDCSAWLDLDGLAPADTIPGLKAHRPVSADIRQWWVFDPTRVTLISQRLGNFTSSATIHFVDTDIVGQGSRLKAGVWTLPSCTSEKSDYAEIRHAAATSR